MKKIIIDTNFLMVPYKFRVDIFSELNRVCNFNYQLFIFQQSINELKNIINKQSGKNRKAAQFALKLIKLKNINIIKSDENEDVDSLILQSVNKNTVIATQDTKLKKELLKKGSAIITLRQKKYLQLLEGKLYK
jgi:rRNA-processing protein FCF1